MQSILHHWAAPRVCFYTAGVSAIAAGATFWAGGPVAAVVGAAALVAIAAVGYLFAYPRPTECRVHSQYTLGKPNSVHWEFKLYDTKIVIRDTQEDRSRIPLIFFLSDNRNTSLHKETPSDLAAWLNDPQARVNGSMDKLELLADPPSRGQQAVEIMKTGFEAIQRFLRWNHNVKEITMYFTNADRDDPGATPQDFGISAVIPLKPTETFTKPETANSMLTDH